MMRKKLVAVCCVCVMVILLGLAGQAQAGTVEYAVQSDGTITHYFYHDKDGPSEVYDTLAAQWWVTHPFPDLTADFSANKTLEVTFSAPEGKAFQFTVPTGAYHTGISFVLDSHDGGYGPFEDAVATIEWLGLVGTEPSFDTEPTEYSWLIGSQTFYLQGQADVTAPFSITGFKLTFAVPADFNADWENQEIFRGDVMFGARSYEWTTDPGQIVTLIPEPATMLLLGFGTFGLLRKRRA